MKKTITKTVEIFVCDQCGEEGEYHRDRCDGCGKDVCTNCVHHFAVSVDEVKPRRYGTDNFGHTVTTCYEFTFSGLYCGLCSHFITQVLRDAGLVKSQGSQDPSPVVAVEDRSL
jgi:hypothetical protein